jgi:hypothetical protein
MNCIDLLAEGKSAKGSGEKEILRLVEWWKNIARSASPQTERINV